MKNLRIGTRLTLGFAVVLLFLVALTGIGVWRMQQASVMTDNMVKQTVRNERLIDEWAKVIEVNAARTTDIQTVLGESVKQPRARAQLSQVVGVFKLGQMKAGRRELALVGR